ncbi:hypothetical protein BABA_15522 [Neobacillus bataviensis LMG 21833]|uniref:Uncharacterized protein n=1 Tax=Neobacillus bataviensis LMG 21833 TaxID=1117379 RepID=K6D239_9BACI|nr:hypothetical protein BABA_15522 [Neobacillus bataviensis LMG 21833]
MTDSWEIYEKGNLEGYYVPDSVRNYEKGNIERFYVPDFVGIYEKGNLKPKQGASIPAGTYFFA